MTASKAPDTSASAADRACASLVPLLIVVLPLIALASVSFSMPVLAPALMTALHRPPTDYGWMAGASSLGIVIFFFCNHAISPALGPVGTLRLGMLSMLCGAGLILTGLWPVMIFGAVCVGFGFATNITSGSQLLADFTPKSSWGILFSLRQAAIPMGGVVAAAVAGLTLASYGWRVPLMVTSSLLAMALVAVALLPRRYNQVRPLVPFVAANLIKPANIIRPFGAISNRPGFPAFVAAGCGLSIGQCAVAEFFVLHLVNAASVTIEWAAILFAISQLSAVLGRIVLGVVADRSGAPSLVLAIMATVSAAASLTMAVYPAFWPPEAQIGGAIFIGVAAASWSGLFMAEIARMVPAADVSAATADCAVFGFMAFMITPPLFALLATQLGWRSAFLIIAIAPLLAGLFLLARQVWPVDIGRTNPAQTWPALRRARRQTGIGVGVLTGGLALACLAVVLAFAAQKSAGFNRTALNAKGVFANRTIAAPSPTLGLAAVPAAPAGTTRASDR